MVIEPFLEPLITMDQRGFLTGRSMLANLLDVDESMLQGALRDDGTMAVFYDFAAAFPSIEHELMHKFFNSLGWPTWLTNIIKRLYHNNHCQIAFAGIRYSGCKITRGIRQGCPLSPLLFAVTSDLFLRRLAKIFPTSSRRAWADDLAMVIPNAMQHLPALYMFFSDFASISGLHLNIPKTVLVPLAPFDEQAVREEVRATTQAWGNIVIASTAKYLGFYVGPGREGLSWEAPLQKYLKRARLWGKLGVGAYLSMDAYKIYICSVLSFVGQLDNLPDNWRDFELKACSALFPGPTRWITPGCLKELKAMHSGKEWPNLDHTTLASKARVLRFENITHGGLRAVSRWNNLKQLMMDAPCSLGQIQFVAKWASNSFLFNLKAADDKQRQLTTGLTDTWLQVRAGWQCKFTKLIKVEYPHAAMQHLRRRLDRWRMSTLPGHRVRRALNMLKTIGEGLPPRVWAAYFRLICNGWITARRFQGSGKCLFGCGNGHDSIEHFAHCPVVSHWLHENLGISPAPVGEEMDHFLGMRIDEERDDTHMNSRIRRGLATYALYKVHNGVRHQSFGDARLGEVFAYFLQEGRSPDDNS